jgi:hypothetical protein
MRKTFEIFVIGLVVVYVALVVRVEVTDGKPSFATRCANINGHLVVEDFTQRCALTFAEHP